MPGEKDLFDRRSLIKSLLIAGGSLFVSPAGGCDRGAGAPAGNDKWRPAYLNLEDKGKLAGRVEEARKLLSPCVLCPRMCKSRRTSNETGFCRAPGQPVVFSHQAHYGEELPLVGNSGSGTIFFSHCSLRCVFCQNWPIAHEGRGRRETEEDLAGRMLALQRRGCHNINLVTPTHMMPFILKAVRLAAAQGLELPLVYNTGGYERKEVIELLDGVVDIYMPDLKFMDPAEAEKYTGGAEDYPVHAMASIAEMHRQVGVLQTDRQGIARRGLMLRHLVMPNHVAGTEEFVTWVADMLGEETYVNIMSQYRVEHEAYNYPAISRAITAAEFLEAMDWAEEAGLKNLDRRSISQRNIYRRRN